MNILHVIGTLDPAFGGPVEALRQQTVALHELGHRSEVVTSDPADAPWLHDFPGMIYALGPSWLKYRYNPRLMGWLQAHVGRYDVVIASGIWQYQTFAVWRAARRTGFPYFVFVHGMLDPWFKRAFPLKHAKKWLYWPWATYPVLRDAEAVLFVTDKERLLARQSFWLYRAHEAVVGYGIGDPGGDPLELRKRFLDAYPTLAGKRLVLFISRIHPKKGCDLLIDAFAQAALRDPSLYLIMAGPDTDGWQAGLMDLARAREVAERIHWTGMLSGELKWGAFRAAEVFVLPSHSENFGVVVVEALACGLPVLITDKVNIWQEIVEDGAGFAETDTQAGAAALLRRWLALPPERVSEMRVRARACFERHFTARQAAHALVDVIERRREGSHEGNLQ